MCFFFIICFVLFFADVFLFVCFIIVSFFILFLFLFPFYSYYTINFTITIFSSLLSPLHSPSFSCAKIHCSHSQLLFLPLLTHSPPALTFPSHSPPTCHHTTPPSHTLTACWPTYYTNFTQPQLPAIPDTSTLHYSNRNTPKHTQEPQNPAASTLLSPLTHPTSCLLF
jgi:hypothetical protein